VQCKIADCIPANCVYLGFNNEVQQSAARVANDAWTAVCSFPDQVQDFDQ
jgi:hypothetical protein